MATLDAMYSKLEKDLVRELLGNRKLAVVQAPPGSGKTHMLLAVVSKLVENGLCIALAAQTNRQADDIAHRWSRDFQIYLRFDLGAEAVFPQQISLRIFTGRQNPKIFPEARDFTFQLLQSGPLFVILLRLIFWR